MSSDAQILANRRNSQLSTGPTTSDGKAKSSLNAVKTGLTGRTVLLPDEDVELYTKHVADFAARWQPENDRERGLVQSLADTEWRILRIPSLEMAIYAMGRLEFAAAYPDQNEAVRPALIQAKVNVAYERQLKNLDIQEARLCRQRDKDVATLRDVIADRQRGTITERDRRLDAAAEQLGSNMLRGEKKIETYGFEFTREEVCKRLVHNYPHAAHYLVQTHHPDKSQELPVDCDQPEKVA